MAMEIITKKIIKKLANETTRHEDNRASQQQENDVKTEKNYASEYNNSQKGR